MLAPSMLVRLHATRIPSVLQSLHVSVTARGRAVSVDRNDPLRPRWLVHFLLSPTTVVAVPKAECWVLRETIGLSLVFELSD